MTEHGWPGEPPAKGDPERIGPYAVLGRLGAGGMGRIYLGRSPFGRLVAIKTIRSELGGDPGFRARFAQEVAAARRVSGVFTAAVVNADPDAAVPWLATAYVPAPSLESLVRACGPLPPRAVRWMAAGIAEALESVHAAGLVHRDLKPSNVLVASDGPKVIDFGISRAADFGSLTMTGVAVGTPAYMSPEQAQGVRDITPASDMFSLGATLVYAATGHSPYPDRKPAEALLRLVTGSPDLGGLPPELTGLVNLCMQRAAEHRPSPTQLLNQLAPLLDDSGADSQLPDNASAMVQRFESQYRPTMGPRTPPVRDVVEPEQPELPENVRPDPNNMGKLPNQVREEPRPVPRLEPHRAAPPPPQRPPGNPTRKPPPRPPAPPTNTPVTGRPPGPLPVAGHRVSTSAPAPALPTERVARPPAPIPNSPVTWPEGGPDVPRQHPTPPRTPTGGLETSPVWRFTATGEILTPPVRAGSGRTARVHVHSNDNGLHTLHLATREWRFDSSGWSHPPAVDGELMYLSSQDNHVYALELTSRQWRWSFPTGGEVVAAPVVADGTVYFGSSDNALYAVDAATGRCRWRFPTGGWATSPTVVDGTVYFGSSDRCVYALDAATGWCRWRFATGGWVSSPTVAGGIVHVGSTDQYLYLLNATDGAMRGWFGAGGPVAQPATAGNLSFFGSGDGGLYAVDVNTTRCVWRFGAEGWVTSPVVADDIVYAGSSNGSVIAVGLSGEPRWRFTTGGRVTSPVVADGLLFVGSADRHLYVLDAATGKGPSVTTPQG
ncbi:PQQ-binding-like beta-propeller repeat protein [Embleya sp. AB8]|uniref:outer membrane protein assembly factor BamB family protein n=1 Tax=Embleya sp. AB8 TaxID=3156304 RepID=UPI003C78D723